MEQVLQRVENAKSDSDFTYYWSLLLAGEALAKTIILGILAAINDDKDRNRYRLEYLLARADGLGDWCKVIEDALTGTASQYLLNEARTEKTELTRQCREGDWQYNAVAALKTVLELLEIEAEEVPLKSDMKRWFRLFVTLRNKTRGHGATLPANSSKAVEYLVNSIKLFYNNFSLFNRPWAYLHRNISGKYRVSLISPNHTSFDFLKKECIHSFPNGVYIYFGSSVLRHVALIDSDPELQDFFFANGGFNGKTFELLSYYTDHKKNGDASLYSVLPGTLPSSETEGHGELLPQGNCFSNAPEMIRDYIPRPRLEDELFKLLLDDKRPIITLVGRGGIGKTSLALKVLQQIHSENRYTSVVWFSSRDVDLQFTGAKPVHPRVFSYEDMSNFYATLVLSPKECQIKTFNARSYFEKQLHKCDLGPCLFVFDNFETTQNPSEIFNWIDTFIRLPNKVLITTRLRVFKGDYPVEVQGMDEPEAKKLIDLTAEKLKISGLLNKKYVDELISRSEGHPYVIKILLGEVAKAKRAVDIARLVAGTEDILTALFERTYSALTPCAQRAYLTLSAWNSLASRLALEAVLIKSTEERHKVEEGIETLLQFSMAEIQIAADNQEFIGLPLISRVFGKKKLNVSRFKDAVQSDVEILQMFGPSRRGDIHLGLAKKLESFIANIAQRIDKGVSYDSFAPILEMICRSYPLGWRLLARWHMEIADYEKAKEELQKFLQSDPQTEEKAEAWYMLGNAYYQTRDALGEVNALIEQAQISSVCFRDISNTANRLNELLRDGLEIDKEEKCVLAKRILLVMDKRRNEATADDFSRMAWLAIRLGQETQAREYINDGLKLESNNYHCHNIAERLGINL